MGLLIDGYNLLHVTDIFGGGGAGSFERSRIGLLNFIASVVAPQELPRTIVVFDASQAPPGLPSVVQHAGIAAHFAKDYESADELLEELIRKDHNPRQLTVVSSDHRVQRAALRRRAIAVDSEVWYAQVLRERHSQASKKPAAETPTEQHIKTPLPKSEVAFWLAEFERTEAAAGKESAEASPPSPKKNLDAKNPDAVSKNPFPPGYAEDLL